MLKALVINTRREKQQTLMSVSTFLCQIDSHLYMLVQHEAECSCIQIEISQ